VTHPHGSLLTDEFRDFTPSMKSHGRFAWNGYSQFGTTEKTRNSYGFYAHADQMVYQETPGSEQGLTLFTAAGYYPQDNISIIPFQLDVGGFYSGLILGRERDKTIFGVIYGRFGDQYGRTLEAEDRLVPL